MIYVSLWAIEVITLSYGLDHETPYKIDLNHDCPWSRLADLWNVSSTM